MNIVMKPKLTLLTGAAAVSVFALPAFAFERVEGASNPAEPNARVYTGQPHKFGHVARANEILGTEVKNLQGEKLGKVEDLAVDLGTGRIVQVILSVGGVLGVGDKTLAIPPRAFTCNAPKQMQLDSTKEKLQSAPVVELSKWNELSQPNRVADSYRYFGQSTEYDSLYQLKAGEKTPVVIPQLERASKLVGMAVKNPSDDKLGKVDNLVLDVEGGRLLYVIVATGGVVGIGEELHTIPPQKFTFNSERDALQLAATKQELSSNPRFKRNEWPDFNNPAYASGVYQAYRVEPYFGKRVDADNTGRNVRDRDEKRLTPLDQGTSESDLDITRRIRKQLMDTEGLSTSARNVKIITQNGRVTLRGPVNSEEERKRIEKIAQEFAQPVQIANDLEVKAPANP
jgi:sporulation protein YlmC with PRC-barrel domain